MKTLLLTITSIAALGTASVNAEPTEIIRTTGCYLLDGAGTPFFDPECDKQFVITNSRNDNVNVNAKGRVPEGYVFPNRGMKWSGDTNPGFTCLGSNTTWRMTVSPSGNISLTCNLAD